MANQKQSERNIEKMIDEAKDSFAAMKEFNRLRSMGYSADKIAADLRAFLAMQQAITPPVAL